MHDRSGSTASMVPVARIRPDARMTRLAGPVGRLALLVVTAAIVAACVISRSTEVSPRSFPRGADSVAVASPIRAHLIDGSVVVFRDGATVVRDTIRGAAIAHDPLRATREVRDRVPLDSVIGVETFRSVVNSGRTVLYSTLATAATTVGTIGILKALFGSCPTFYADSADTVMLEAEGFSYSISSLLEARDIDRLRARPDSTGMLRLEVRNEALETHYINQLALVESRHRAEEAVLPDHRGQPVAISGTLPVTRLTDAAGRDVASMLTAGDGWAFASDSVLLAAASRGGPTEDAIEIVAPHPGTDSVAVVLRLRNSLLTTVLFYDHMLDMPGGHALNWVSGDLERIASTAALGKWYAAHFGLRAWVNAGGEWLPVGRLGDQGPIAWRDAAFVVPAPAGDSVRIRLTFLADEWRIDRLSLSPVVRRPATRMVPLGRVMSSAGNELPDALALLGAADEDYLQTMPGNQFQVAFDVGREDSVAAPERRTFLLVSQGYYTEWVRGEWLKGGAGRAFTTGDSTLSEVMRTWVAQKASMERQFHRSRVPVR